MSQPILSSETIIVGIYRSTRVELPEFGENVGVWVRYQNQDFEIVGEVVKVDPLSRLFDVRLVNVNGKQVEYLFKSILVPIAPLAPLANSTPLVLDVSTRGELQ